MKFNFFSKHGLMMELKNGQKIPLNVKILETILLIFMKMHFLLYWVSWVSGFFWAFNWLLCKQFFSLYSIFPSSIIPAPMCAQSPKAFLFNCPPLFFPSLAQLKAIFSCNFVSLKANSHCHILHLRALSVIMLCLYHMI